MIAKIFLYSHAATFYLAHRGGCICYSGDFIFAKEDFTKAFKRDEVPVGAVTFVIKVSLKQVKPSIVNVKN